MPARSKVKKILFVINAGSGSKSVDYEQQIISYFANKNVEAIICVLPEKIDKDKLKAKIDDVAADRVVAVGGDGTLKLVAECLVGTDTPVGIIAAGSANGMAKELFIPEDPQAALELILNGEPMQIHLVKIEEELCIHLADLGFNAYLVRKFDTLPGRGMWNYAKATWHALVNHKRMDIELNIKGATVKSKAAMVAIANATKYGSGLKINPDGRLDDDVFEVILVKDYSYFEILKVWFTNLPFNPEKVQVFQTNVLKITSKHKAHFQVDGEYIGKVNSVSASLLPAAIQIICGKAFGAPEQ